MPTHTGNIAQKTGSDAALGAPVQWLATSIEADSSTALMGATVQAFDTDPVKTYTAEDMDITAQPLHPRPVRLAWTATTGTVRSVTFRTHAYDFWRRVGPSEEIKLTVQGTEDTQLSIRHLGAVTVTVDGDAGSDVTISFGLGTGIGSPVRFKDESTTINDMVDEDNNKDILAVKSPADDTDLTVTELIADPYNTILFAATPTDVKVEAQTTFGELVPRRA